MRIWANPRAGGIGKNTYASETPATDGERVYASFGGNVGLFCYSMDGKLLWKHTWKPQPIYLDFGTASSPVVHGGRVYQLHDTEAESTLTALDAKTGAVVWTVERPVQPSLMKSGWSTPFIWESGSRTEIVVIGKKMAISYGSDGKELWRMGGMTQATPTPIAGGGLLYVGSGSQGEANRPMFAVKPGGSGDISLKTGETSGPFVAWFQPRVSGYTGSPLSLPGPAVCDQRQRRAAGARRATGRKSTSARRRHRQHVLELASRQQRPHLRAQRRRRYVCLQGWRFLRRAREERAERDESLVTSRRCDELLHPTQRKLYRLTSR
jgi:outer membrane protein assembly factor BamB